jgi:hypothetical protein
MDRIPAQGARLSVPASAVAGRPGSTRFRPAFTAVPESAPRAAPASPGAGYRAGGHCSPGAFCCCRRALHRSGGRPRSAHRPARRNATAKSSEPDAERNIGVVDVRGRAMGTAATAVGLSPPCGAAIPRPCTSPESLDLARYRSATAGITSEPMTSSGVIRCTPATAPIAAWNPIPASCASWSVTWPALSPFSPTSKTK